MFLAPGLLHQLGNLFLTIQGATLTLDGNNLERTRQVVRTANDRGTASLQVMRVLLGQPQAGTIEAATLMEQILELVRVPLRERGQGLELRRPVPADLWVEFDAFLWSVVECVRQVAMAIPDGVHGGLVLTLQRTGANARAMLGCRFQAVAGTLPFPLPTAAIARGLEGGLHGRGIAVECSADAMGVDLLLPAAAALRAREA